MRRPDFRIFLLFFVAVRPIDGTIIYCVGWDFP